MDFAAMTVSLDAPLPEGLIGWLRSLAPGLTVDLLIADLIDGGAWGASVCVDGVVRTFGITADGGNWTTTARTPDGSTRVVKVGSGAVATSTTTAAQGPPPPGAPDACEEPDQIIWSAAQAEMAWQAQVAADSLVGLNEAAALGRLARTGETALLYRHDCQLRDISTG